MPKPKQYENTVRITLRLPADIHAAVERLAVEHDRSLNQEIVHLLRRAIAAPAAEDERSAD